MVGGQVGDLPHECNCDSLLTFKPETSVKDRISDSNFEALVDYAYDAAFDESLWPAFLERFADALGGRNTALILHDKQSGRNSAVACVRTDADYLRRYNEHYCEMNPWMRNGSADLAAGMIGIGEMHCTSEELIRTEFYNEWLRPQKLKHSIAALLATSGNRVVVCSTLRTAAAGPFGQDHIEVLKALLRHVRRALRTRERARDVFDTRSHALELLDALPQACVLVNREGRAVFVNRAAERTLAGNAPLRLGASGLTAVRHQDTVALHRLISRAASLHPCGGEMAIDREHGQPMVILVSPIRSRYQLPAPPQAVAAVWISIPDDRFLSRSTRIRVLFGLTSAESALAAEIARGMSLAEIAEARNISRHTARNQLKSIFAKTGARSQADLVRLVLSCPDLLDDERRPE
jgi:DNA-binding CsgD family transcriptional regulator/PAS domain-containing protein